MDVSAPGDPQERFSVPIHLQKEPQLDEAGNPVYEENGKQRLKCGFRIGGGIDQDPTKSPQGYPDKGVYVTFLYEHGPAHRAGLQINDKILQVNGHDMTMVTHKKACDYIKRKPVLQMLVHRKGLPTMPPTQQQRQASPMETQFHSHNQGMQYMQYSDGPSQQTPQFHQQPMY